MSTLEFHNGDEVEVVGGGLYSGRYGTFKARTPKRVKVEIDGQNLYFAPQNVQHLLVGKLCKSLNELEETHWKTLAANAHALTFIINEQKMALEMVSIKNQEKLKQIDSKIKEIWWLVVLFMVAALIIAALAGVDLEIVCPID